MYLTVYILQFSTIVQFICKILTNAVFNEMILYLCVAIIYIYIY